MIFERLSNFLKNHAFFLKIGTLCHETIGPTHVVSPTVFLSEAEGGILPSED